MNRRTFTTLTALAAARSLVAQAAPSSRSRVGLCTFSCKNQWAAARKSPATAPFHDAPTFYDYARALGGDGVQTGARELTMEQARKFRAHVENTGGYYEGDVRMPKTEKDLADFEREVKLAKEAGAKCARVILMGGRRYEVFKTLDEFKAYRTEGLKRLQLAEPIAHKHGLVLAMENHKDFLVPEQIEVLKQIDSEWLRVLVDTGNNIAMCEEPYAVIEALAPYAVSCHLKDIAVQKCDGGFLISEVPFGTGFLDLKRIVRTLATANPTIDFHVEMATRDPLFVPCESDAYWSVFPERREADLQRTLAMVAANPPKQAPPIVTGLSTEQALAAEEKNNRVCFNWAVQ